MMILKIWKKGDVDVNFVQKEGIFDIEEVDGGDQFMAVKPWKGTVKNSQPSNYVKTEKTGSAPD